MPTLAERPDDIEPLARHFLARHKERYGRHALEPSRAAIDALEAYPWPGNVRELDHIVERAVLLAAGERIEPGDLRLEDGAGVLADSMPLTTLDQAEKALIRSAIEQSRGNVARAADILGLSRSALYRRMEKHGIEK